MQDDILLGRILIMLYVTVVMVMCAYELVARALRLQALRRCVARCSIIFRNQFVRKFLILVSIPEGVDVRGLHFHGGVASD